MRPYPFTLNGSHHEVYGYFFDFELSFALFNTSQFGTLYILSLLACSLVFPSIAGSFFLAGVSPT